MLGMFPDLVVEDPEEDLICWANRSESYMKRNGEGLNPLEGIFDYPDLLARGWGWKRLVTSVSSPEDMPTYKKYLEEYYIRNTAESVAQEWLNEQDANSASYGTGVETRFLETLAKLCIEAEEKFINKRKMYRPGPADEINLSEKILQGVRKIMSSEGEFPVAPAVVMFITKEAELMCEWLEIGTYKPAHDWCISINNARKCALGFLEYKGPESSSVAGLMIGIAKETKEICEGMREKARGCIKASSDAILLDGWEVLEELHGEIFSASQDGAIAEINIVGELTSKENDGKDSCKTKAIEVDLDDATLYSNRSLCHLETAPLVATSCINIWPESLEGYYRKGNALMSLKEYKEAFDAFLAGLKLDPTNVDMKRMLREAVEAMKKDHVAT